MQDRAESTVLGKGPKKKSRLVMVFFRKGGGVSTQSITLRHIFVPQSYGLFIKNKGGGS